MSRVRVELNRAGLAKWLAAQKGNPKMMAKLTEEGQRLASRAGAGFGVKPMTRRRNRPGVAVVPLTAEAIRAQKKDNRLGRALGGAVK